MSDHGKNCPNCGKDIGVFTSVKAPLPNMIKCPTCKSKIGYKGNYWREYLLVSAVFSIILILATTHSQPYITGLGFTPKQFLFFFGMFGLVLWGTSGTLLSVFLMRNKELYLRDN